MAPEQEDYLFAEHEEVTQEEETTSAFWDVLVVDDDPEIHSVTKLALSNLEFWGKKLRFFHAYSGKEAIEILKEQNNISILLLDVVMETDDAGLNVVRRVREEIKNMAVRIIMRTGQPGYAPEEKVIREFDINDYKMKTELTRSKLVTSLLTAIRSYQQICELEAQSHALEQILSASRAILGHTDMGSFAAAVVAQLANILDASGEGLVSGYLDDDMHLRVFGGSEQYREFFGHGIEQLDNGRVIMQVQNCIDTESHQSTAHDITFLLESKNKKAAIYLELEGEPSEAQLKFAEIFLTNVGVGLDNIKLFNELREVAYKDNLTKLPNRANFIEKIESYFNQQQSLVFILVDIAQFSDINNGLGQEVGNLLLLGVAERISIEFPEAQLISRIGADVFGFLMPESQFDEESFIDNLCVPYHVGEHLLTMHFHIGVCRQEDFQPQGIETLKLAYIALNQAKQSSIPLDWYTPDLEEKMAWKLGLIRQLRQDFEMKKLEVWYQPQFSIVDRKVIGCEALLRWPSGNGNYISPAIFVPLAENAGLIVEIGQWVLEQACQLQATLQQQGFGELSIAVNVSVPQFKVPNYAQQVKDTILSFDVEPKHIELEVTESVVMDEVNSVINTLQELQEFGVEVAIDDFGTGFSSLSYLQKLPLARLKIDRAFVKDIPHDDSGAIADLVISLGQHLGLKTIAEGVETEEQMTVLQKLGCDEVQGFLLAKPMPEKELLEFLDNQNSV
ncbi:MULTISPECIES: bifunctional diguanylate cyclase/phosphodiesterase [Pseudoalteromonas]|jgi:diguanylate cyclase (GGDEF)-like protein|uniref:bifunctional diguanylate cyclase/phosphodiesterase n=1 Tax=Pseudoalteromonas TaxID=53246 RepID=UPI000299FA07|nr:MULTISPECIES: EAL domain-containing protein [Pseudoalteromonas]AUJ68735.1 Phytochrome-like protein cph2 [Pseudoalteromonas sp. NC201]MCF2825704.1 EAL domain-containing protein [Pseudoalteromonas sp. OF5H-5]MCF2833802.1 EAL domain-containing protein [Pseudoalteromonas sp. DL2-H6]MCF2923736.1 EAL domain-containing protein [Pseudoalteromonas sp. DL2-H1]MCF7513776.1 EAL domain-containing protein [Pseudoalteromonas sp. L7]